MADEKTLADDDAGDIGALASPLTDGQMRFLEAMESARAPSPLAIPAGESPPCGVPPFCRPAAPPFDDPQKERPKEMEKRCDDRVERLDLRVRAAEADIAGLKKQHGRQLTYAATKAKLLEAEHDLYSQKYYLWIFLVVALFITVAVEVGLFFVNVKYGNNAAASATNTIVAVSAILGWWFTGVSEAAREIRTWQEKIADFTDRERANEKITTIDTTSRFRMTYLISRRMEI